jgi:hypothetical protein
MPKEKTILLANLFLGSTKVYLIARCSKGRIDDIWLKAYLGQNLFQTVRLLA